uniref:Centriolar satellite-associated tubulin polyglutamylase complex regulator 1 n=1 Tax=Ficedula albicollis TaxID=59894 RepID=A0A803W1Q8_FICAL
MEMAVWACIISALNMQDAVELCLFAVSAMYNIEQQFKPQSGRSGGCFVSFKLLSVLLEFLESVAAIYQDLLAGKNPNTVIVPTSSSGQHRQRQPPNDCNPLEGVEASLFYQCLESLCDRSKYSCPPSALVKEILSSVQRMTFYGFLMALAKDQGINRALGALPDKGDLFLDPAMDQELEKLVAQVSGLSLSASSSADTANMPVRNSPRINSPWKPLHHRRKMDAESEGSNEETDSSEN